MISHLAQSLARDSAIHNSRPRPSSARSARTGHGYSESTEAGGSSSELLKRARYAPHLVTLPKLPTAAEGVVPRAPEFPEYPRPVSHLAKRGVQVELEVVFGPALQLLNKGIQDHGPPPVRRRQSQPTCLTRLKQWASVRR